MSPRAKRKKKGEKLRAPGHGAIWEQGGNWWIRWREHGTRRTAKFPRGDLAEQALNKIVADIAAGRVGLPVEPAPPETLGVHAERWLARRAKTHRAAKEDVWQWRKHLEPVFGHLTPQEVNRGLLRRFIEQKLAEGLSSSTVRLLVAEMSTLFTDLIEQEHATENPMRKLPRATRRLIRPAHDPETTPFIEKLDDIRRIYLALPEPVNVAYALGVLAMLRNGEALALRWVHVDLEARRLHIRESVEGPLKDDDSRIVPILDPLYPLLAEWKLRRGAAGTVVPSMHADGKNLGGHAIRKHLKVVLETLGLPQVTWYQATRHTGASHWVMAGNGIEKLSKIMGHSSVQVTERYAHLRPDAFNDADRATIKVSLAPAVGSTVSIKGAIGVVVSG